MRHGYYYALIKHIVGLGNTLLYKCMKSLRSYPDNIIINPKNKRLEKMAQLLVVESFAALHNVNILDRKVWYTRRLQCLL